MDEILSFFVDSDFGFYENDSNLQFNDNFSRMFFNIINEEMQLLSSTNNSTFLNTGTMSEHENQDVRPQFPLEEVSIRLSMYGLSFPNEWTTNFNGVLNFNNPDIRGVEDSNSQRTVMTREQIDAIERCFLETSTECYICLDKLLPGSRVRRLKCKHMFCIDCIDNWLSEYNNQCPVCKTTLN